MPTPPRRFPKPWKIEENRESFVVQDSTGFPIAYIYFEDEPVRANTLKRMSKDEARRIANRVAQLPELIEIEKQFRNQA
jgi:hypothetical protein